jgi:Trypsin-co-occurring domain 1
MADVIPVKLKDGTTIYIEGAESVKLRGLPAIQNAGLADQAEKSLVTAQELTNSVKAFCGHIMSSFRDLGKDAQPSKAIIEFGLNISLEGNVYLVKTSGQASIKITAEWELDGDGGNPQK